MKGPAPDVNHDEIGADNVRGIIEPHSVAGKTCSTEDVAFLLSVGDSIELY